MGKRMAKVVKPCASCTCSKQESQDWNFFLPRFCPSQSPGSLYGYAHIHNLTAFKATASSQTILSQKASADHIFHPGTCFFPSLSFQDYINWMHGSCLCEVQGQRHSDTHHSLCHPDGSCSCKKDSAPLPSINASLFVPRGLSVTYRNTPLQALWVTALLEGMFQTMNFSPSSF